MSLESDDRVIVTAECCEHAAADGHGTRIVSCHSGRLLTRNQAITAMVLAVVAKVVVAATISYLRAYELVRSHGESGMTARLLPFTVDGLIWAASTVALDASRRNQAVPRLAAWSLGAGHLFLAEPA